ncbi:hypothetical protein J6590_083565 [Homalodisca vitripennis]|nr:hypothetical protein J6590_083565 [Homalodisca vitripennis]
MGAMTAISYHLPSRPPSSIIHFPPPSPSPTLTTLSDITRLVGFVLIAGRRKKGSTSQLNDEENILTSENTFEVSSLGVQRAILAKVNSLVDMRAKVDSIEESMKFIADKNYSLLAEVMGLRKENGEN